MFKQSILLILGGFKQIACHNPESGGSYCVNEFIISNATCKNEMYKKDEYPNFKCELEYGIKEFELNTSIYAYKFACKVELRSTYVFLKDSCHLNYTIGPILNELGLFWNSLIIIAIIAIFACIGLFIWFKWARY